MPACVLLACGICWNLVSSAAHAASSDGGKAPDTGFHSVMESPLSVSRVIPPTATAKNTATMESNIQRRSARRSRSGSAPGRPRSC